MKFPNPVPTEAIIQFRRHLIQIREERGYNLTIQKADVNIVPESMDKSNISGDKNVVINVAWDLDTLIDHQANQWDSYRSTIDLNCYLLRNQNPHILRGQLMADLIRYFYDQSGVEQRWTLFNENNWPVVRTLKFQHFQSDITFEKQPIFKLDSQVIVTWACKTDDLYTSV